MCRCATSPGTYSEKSPGGTCKKWNLERPDVSYRILPFLIPVFVTAALIAGGVVIVELLVIAWIRNRFMDTPLLAATFQVVVGGVIVFLAGILIGSS